MARSAPIEAWWMYGIDRFFRGLHTAARQNRGTSKNGPGARVEDEQVALRDAVHAQRLVDRFESYQSK